MSEKRLKEQIPHHLPQIRRVVAKIAQDNNLVDDISQECCVRIIEKEDLWDGNQNKLKQWINRVTRNLTINFVNKQRREASYYREMDLEAIEVPHSGQLHENHIRWIMTQLQSLPPMQKKVIHLKYFEGMNSSQIACELNISQQTVFTHLNRALRSFRRKARGRELLAFLLPWNWNWQALHPKQIAANVTTTSKAMVMASIKYKTTVIAGALAAGLWMTSEIYPDVFSRDNQDSEIGLDASSLHNNIDEFVNESAEPEPQHVVFKTSHKNESLLEVNNSVPSMVSERRIEKQYYVTGELKTEIPYFGDDVIDGKKITYFRSGVVMSEINYQQGKQQGIQKMYYQDGSLFYTWPHEDDLADGVKKVYYQSGQLQSEIPFVGGLEHGLQKLYYEDGTLREKIEFSEGLIQGLAVTYYPTGQIDKEEIYNQGRKNGKSRSFFDSGELKTVSFYENGSLVDESIYYYKSGKIKSIYPYQKGIVHGRQLEFYPSGELKSETTYEQGLLHGPQWVYDENGEIVEKKIFEKNRLISSKMDDFEKNE